MTYFFNNSNVNIENVKVSVLLLLYYYDFFL